MGSFASFLSIGSSMSRLSVLSHQSDSSVLSNQSSWSILSSQTKGTRPMLLVIPAAITAATSYAVIRRRG
ncbi:hypothetical protein GCM10023350_14140 [Nocardioides endophyticus]|uniref:Uncharacterized protein n=1 Tax=Nocardioides endophyticus TaxID=1353775 RepID=A0ABP8YL74_9ACTN